MKSNKEFKNECVQKTFNELSNLLLNENISKQILQEDEAELHDIVRTKILAKRMKSVAEILSKKEITLSDKNKADNVINDMVKLFYMEQFSKEAKENDSTKDLLNYCVKTRAWNDATQYVRKTDNCVNGNKDVITDFIIKALEIENPDFKSDFDVENLDLKSDFDKWHRKIRKNEIKKIDSSWGMTTGLWQKLINMSFKYLYCVKDKFAKFDKIWGNCHCPIDSIILDRLYNILKDILKEEPSLCDPVEFECVKEYASGTGKKNWNNLNEDDYNTIQQVIAKVCKRNNITPLQFDFLYW